MNSHQRRKFTKALFTELRSASKSELEIGLIDAAAEFVRHEKLIDSLQAENAALKEQVAQLKTVPMKYRRMEFNAKLQDENADLSKQLSTLQSKSAALVDALEWYFDPTIDSWKRNAIIRKALDELSETSHALGGY